MFLQEDNRSTTVAPATSLAHRFCRDESGNVALTFGLMVIPCMVMLGMAVDWGRMLHTQTQLQGIVDNMALAAGREVQKSTANYDTIAATTATNFWNAHKGQVKIALADNTTMTPTSNTNKTEFKFKLTTWVPTPFMTPAQIIAPRGAATGAPAGCNTSFWQCQQVSVDATVKLKSGGNNKDQHVETAMMLDVTGSMSGQKFTDMQLAAKDLIDIVVWNDQSQVTSRVAIAPFAASVNVGNYTSGDRALLNPNNLRGTVTEVTSNPALNVLGLSRFTFMHTNNSQQTYRISPHCVSERQGAHAFTDVSPAVAALGRVYQNSSNYSSTNAFGRCDMIDANPSDPETNLVMPLSNDRVALKNRIDKLRLAGSTAGQMGTAWAWYLLSPNWASYFPTASAPKAYNDTKVRKIAVLMTDGDYNTQFWNGVWDKNSYSKHASSASPNGSSQSQASALCTGMKAKNIEVFTVGFQVSSNARTFLKTCATSEAHYYDATSGEALRMAFRDIALKISSLVLSD